MAAIESFSTPGWVDGYSFTFQPGSASISEDFSTGWNVDDWSSEIDEADEATFSLSVPTDIEQFANNWGVGSYKIGFGSAPGGPTTVGSDGFPVPGVDPNGADASLVLGIADSFESGWDNDAYKTTFSGGDTASGRVNAGVDAIESFENVYADQQVTYSISTNIFATTGSSVAAPQAGSIITLIPGVGSQLPTPLQPNTPYACLGVGGHPNEFQVALVGSGSPITCTDSGNGTFTVRGDPSLFWVGDDVMT